MPVLSRIPSGRATSLIDSNARARASCQSDNRQLLAVLFTDIESSTTLWEQDSDRMGTALARHDALVRAAVDEHSCAIVKMIGDGAHAVFADPRDALLAALQILRALDDPVATAGVTLKVRCGVHAGMVERRDGDYFGSVVNRAARIANAAHGGQLLLSRAVVDLAGDRLPEAVSLRDLGTVRLRDLASPERIYQLLHQDLRDAFPALRSLEATPNNLPQQVTSFSGHDEGRAEVHKLLANARLVTLFGMGGLGKTRLSLQVAADVLDDFADGVWLVELAAVADARRVPEAVASVLGVMEDAGRPVLEALVRHVRDRQLLLILDNCEHLIGASAELARTLLQAGTRVRILASSREHLRVTGETTYPVPALALPAPQAATDVALLQRSDAVRLGDRLGLLTRGSRTALPRQRTLRALIDWSFDLLDDTEKILFARLSVFAGGMTIEAAEAVGADAAIAKDDVFDLLVALVEKSLVECDASGERYRLLETVREYARQKLDASDARRSSTSRSRRHLRASSATRADCRSR